MRGPSGRLGANVKCRVNVCLRTSATRAPRPCGLRRTCDDDAVRACGRPTKIRSGGGAAGGDDDGSYLVDPASSHMLVSKIKPCMCKYELIQTVKLRMAH